MFDDNIGRPDSGCGAHIVDVRDVSTGQAVPFDTALARHLVRAEPFLAIQDRGASPPGAAAPAAGAATPAATSGHNFFLLEVLRRLAPERVVSLVENSGGGGFSSAPEP